MPKQEPRIRDVIAIDGEGITPDKESGTHLYTLLMAYTMRGERATVKSDDSLDECLRQIEDWEHGLSTSRILAFLTGQGRNALAKPHDYLAVTYFMNYDVTMWLKDLSDKQKETLWEAGSVFWADPETQNVYYIEYMPGKIFFAGVCPDEILTSNKKPNTFRWPSWRHIRIYDVAGFAQTAFVKAIEGWVNPELVTKIAEGKVQRNDFTPEQREYIKEYCAMELDALNKYVRELQATFLSEGINLSSWHGGGAIANHFLGKYRVHEYVQDPEDECVKAAIMYAYFGGRSEIFRQGILTNVHNYDINSAYPAASIWIPHLVGARWEVRKAYTTEPYALWHVKWDIRSCKDKRRNAGPFPFRLKHEVYFPSTGEGIYHACEVASALELYPEGTILVQGGIACLPASWYRPLGFVEELADKRVVYKTTDPKRAVPYKYGLNSLYGKFAQAHPSFDRQAKYQSYYAAGFVTAMTRAALLRFALQDGRDGSDLIGFMTDGVLCLDDTRTQMIGKGLGQFQYEGQIGKMLLLEPGVWYEEETEEEARRRKEFEAVNPHADMKERKRAKTRGLAKASVGYNELLAHWLTYGNGAKDELAYTFPETRFYGIGYCVGVGNFEKCGKWITEARSMAFTPHKKFSLPFGVHPTYQLIPSDMEPDTFSDPYEPKSPSNPQLALDLWAHEMALRSHYDQPDWSEDE